MAKEFDWKDDKKEEIIVTEKEEKKKDEFLKEYVEGKQNEIANMKRYRFEHLEKLGNLETEITIAEKELADIKAKLGIE